MPEASPSTTLLTDMALALQQAVAMYHLLHQHAAGTTDLTEDQLANVVTGICSDAVLILQRARDEGALAPLPLYRGEDTASPVPVVLRWPGLH